jgi:quinol monooxygenase YgiN
MQNLSRCLALVFMIGVLGAIAPARALASDEPIIIVVRFSPAEGREDEAQARLAKLATFVPKLNPGVTLRLHRSTKGPTVFLLYETFPSQAALENQRKTVLPAFVKEFGATPEGLFSRPNEVEFYRGLSD